ncbi:MAG: glycosyltransferase family 1 protein [Prevotella sp.]|nr:glycosyltransferase family 1 protein [Prevotella sp.]
MNRPIRVLHILQRMEAGGTQSLLMNIYRNIDRTKVQFDFLVEYKEHQFYDDEIEQSGGHIYRTSVREDFNIFKFIRQLNSFFSKHSEYKIIHVHTYSIGFLCLKAAKNHGIKVRIAHSHNNSMTNDYKRCVKYIMQKLYTIYATDLFACSDEAGKYLFHKKNFHVLKNAIDSQKFIANKAIRNEVRKELGITNHFIVGHTGRFHPQKNHKYLVDVFVEIKSKQKDAVLLLIGDGPSLGEVKSYIGHKGLSDCVIMLKNRRDMHRLYQAMDVFAFPSLFEGLGIVAIEAQAAGIPVVCSDRVSEDTNVTPLYARLPIGTENINAWADKCIELANNPLCHTNMQEYIIKAGYDIAASAKFMQDYYINKEKLVTNQ